MTKISAEWPGLRRESDIWVDFAGGLEGRRVEGRRVEGRRVEGRKVEGRKVEGRRGGEKGVGTGAAGRWLRR
jgi:hypothetical protein